MHPFVYRRLGSSREAIATAQAESARRIPPTRATAQYIAGGTNMSDYMRLNVTAPDVLLDINHLTDGMLRRIEADENGLYLGALVRMSEAEDHPVVRVRYPVIRDTLTLAAAPQIRNMATLGGNVLQRTRCEYFRETSWACNKRLPGSGCAALDGMNRGHAVLGTSASCIATYAGDFAQALMVLDAQVGVLGRDGVRSIAFSELHRRPGNTPDRETVLQPGELIVNYRIPAAPWARRSRYVKVRDRDSYQFAVTSAAVALDLKGDTVREARIALGGVATVPWRAREAEDTLRGKVLDESAARAAAEAAFAGAVTRPHNAFKVPLGKDTVVRALLEAKAMEI